eukprot:TRINITY_DN121629_c0_g1_i1.p1 TRINITY_DN121629_c0_g1~~TRINITY_DN121629_c0_g1_i1.p1  ORF type:complete len:499 (+),score=100.89 TRINITY_DN121629_c0_g1_i1:72-1568(+)
MIVRCSNGPSLRHAPVVASGTAGRGLHSLQQSTPAAPKTPRLQSAREADRGIPLFPAYPGCLIGAAALSVPALKRLRHNTASAGLPSRRLRCAMMASRQHSGSTGPAAWQASLEKLRQFELGLYDDALPAVPPVASPPPAAGGAASSPPGGALREAVASLVEDPSLLEESELEELQRWLKEKPPLPPQGSPRPTEQPRASSSSASPVSPRRESPAPPTDRSSAPLRADVSYPPELRGQRAAGQLAPLPDGFKVFIATPAYGGNVTVDYMTSVVNMVTTLKEVAWQLQLTAGESIITVGRNNAVMEFLASDCTHLLFLDADVSFTVDTVHGLLALQQDVVMAPYPAKNINEAKMQEAAARRGDSSAARLRDGLHFVLHAQPQKLQEALDSGSRFVEIDAGPAGCLLIRRGVFDVMQNAYPDLHCRLSGTQAGRARTYDVWWRFFDTMVSEDGEFLGEDIAFCRRWKATGGRIFADFGARMGHVGRHAYVGSMMDGVGDP